MFSGKFVNKIDPKGRIILPAKLRNQAMSTYGTDRPRLALTLSFHDPCLILMSEEQWGRIGEVQSLDLLNPAISAGLRLMSMVNFVDMDEVGRISLPDYLLEMVDIKDQVTLLGCRAYIELWSPEMADANLKGLQENASEIMQRLREELARKHAEERRTDAAGDDEE